jgi:hypothetical protein
VQHELAARRAGVGGDDRNLDAELVGGTGLALADAFGLGGMEGIQLPAALALLLGSDLGGARQREGKRRLDVRLAFDLAANVTDQPAQTRAQDAQFAVTAFSSFFRRIVDRYRRDPDLLAIREIDRVLLVTNRTFSREVSSGSSGAG